MTRCGRTSGSSSDRLFDRVPAGVGSTGFLKLSRQEFRTSSGRGRPLVRRKGMAGTRTWSSPRIAAAPPGPTPRRSARRPSTGASTRSAPSAPATTISRSRWCARRTSSTATSPGPSDLEPRPGRRHVPLREPGIRPPGGHRLPAPLSQGDGEQIRHHGSPTASWPAPLSIPLKGGTILRP